MLRVVKTNKKLAGLAKECGWSQSCHLARSKLICAVRRHQLGLKGLEIVEQAGKKETG